MHIREFFYINKSDRTALVVLLVFAVIVSGLILLLGSHDGHTLFSEADSVATENPFRQSANRRDAKTEEYIPTTTAKNAERFAFDPNTATSEELLRLGLKAWQVKNIMKYRERGGIYRKSSDFARLYGMTKAQYEELEPYIRISDDHRPAAEAFSQAAEREEGPALRDTLRFPVKLREGERLSLDKIDTLNLLKVPGIGRYYARKIVEYGQRLGGYVDVGQLTEIDGFPEESLHYFTVGEGRVRKLKLNTLTLNQLRSHPYLNFYQARAIVDRRRLHGNFKNLDELRLLSEFPDEAISRLAPYVEFNAQ